MATILPARPRQQLPRHTIAAVASQYHPEFMAGLIEHFKKELEHIAPNTMVKVFYVPGCFEIPLMVQQIAAKKPEFEAIVAFGVLVDGQTHHAELIGTTVTNALMECSLRYAVPVLHEILWVTDVAQAEARCLQTELNRGIEAARAAVHSIQALAEFKE